MLSGCGGSAGSSSAMPALNGAGKRLPHHKTFNYAGKKQMFTVPPGVKKLKVIAVGAQGNGDMHGFGGRVYALIPVTPGEKLAIFVGGEGAYSNSSGGFNGGALGGAYPYCNCYGYGGGGASDVREGGDSLRDRIVVAGGGGGAGTDGVPGGGGGGKIGEDGGSGNTYYGGGGGGGGGSQSHGGSGGFGQYGPYGSGGSGSPGTLGEGGSGGQSGNGRSCRGTCYGGGAGGGGGGGYYGGGGGGGGNGGATSEYVGGLGGGGGGGSSYIEPSAYAYRTWRNWKKIHTANGLVVISWQ
jgi:hypothetical protein